MAVGMGHSRPGARGTELLAAVAGLRWARPDLVADVAEHVAEVGSGDDLAWVDAVGWLVHGRSAVGDGRIAATSALDELARRTPELGDDPAAHRLRVEVALLAAAADRTAMARDLVAPVLAGAGSAEVRADAFGVLARCVAVERPESVGDPVRRAEVAWAEVGGAQAETGAAAVALVAASALRRSGRFEEAAERAADGLNRLDAVRGAQAVTPSRHLAAALTAEWIAALIDGGRSDDAREGCGPLQVRLREAARPSKQVALLRLTVVRVLGGAGADAVLEAFEQAAHEARATEAADLEALCQSAIATLHERAGWPAAAGEARRRADDAQRRDAERHERFFAALEASPLAAARPSRAAPSTLWDTPDRSSAIGDLLGRAPAPPDGHRADADRSDQVPDPAAERPPAHRSSPWSSGGWPGVAPAPAVNGRARPDTRVDPQPDRGRGAGTEPSGPSRPIDPLNTDDSGWLQAAMAELDRVFGAAPEPAGVTSPPGLPDLPAPAEDASTLAAAPGCTVVVDVVRSDEAVTDGTAASVVRRIAAELDGVLPGGGRLRRADHAVTVTQPGWSRAEARDWMHRTLPAHFASLVSDEHGSGLALRASVHDGDGPVGAQLVQRLDPAPSRRHGTARPDADGTGRRRRADTDERLGAHSRDGSGPTGPAWARSPGSPRRNGVARATGGPADPAVPIPDAPAAGSDEASRRAGSGGPDTAGQHRAAPPASEPRVAASLPSAGPAATALPTPPAGFAPRSSAPPHRPGSRTAAEVASEGASTATGAEPIETDGLGFADLLAGALAAYRSI